MSENDGHDSGKSRQDLLNELEELRNKLAKRDSNEQADTGEPTFARPITRRTALTKWVAPAVLSIPLTALVRSDARAQAVPIPATTITGTPGAPTAQPPTDTQTQTPQNPTQNPTRVPTRVPTRLEPTRFPTKVAPQVPGLGLGAAAVLGGGLAAGVAKIASDRAKANREAADDDGSKGEE
jgi:hypothetical protein